MNVIAKLKGLWGVRNKDWTAFDKAFEVEAAVEEGKHIAKTRHQTTAPKRGRGRPKGSKNKPKETVVAGAKVSPATRTRRRPTVQPVRATKG